MLTTEQRELVLFIENDAELHRQREVPMQENLLRKMGNETFDFNKSVKLWRFLADAGAQKYTKEFGGRGGSSFGVFSVADRNAVAEEFARDFVAEVRNGNHDIIVTKKKKKDAPKIRRRVMASLSRMA